MYYCVFWCEFVDLGRFFWLLLCDPCHSPQNTNKKYQLSLLTRHRLSYEEVNLHTTPGSVSLGSLCKNTQCCQNVTFQALNV